MVIELFKGFSKKMNSTKRPSNGISKNVKLKDDCSKENPTFILNGLDLDFNYVKWGDHYYFIDDIVVLSNNHIEISCSQDLLATFKNYIGNYNAFVERSASRYNPYINDSFISSTQPYTATTTRSTDIEGYDTVGCYVIRVACGTGLNSYAITKKQFDLLMDYLFTDSNFSDIFSDTTVYKAVFNPFEYIIDVKWFPFTIDYISSDDYDAEHIHFGWWDSSITGRKLKKVALVNVTHINMITKYYNDWRDYNPKWTQYKLYIPSVGYVSINPQDVQENLVIEMCVDFLSGECMCVLRDNNKTNIIAMYNGQIGVPIQVGQLSINAGGALSGTMTAISGFASGDYLQMGAGIVNAVGSVLQPTESVIGNVSNIAALIFIPQYIMTRTVLGTPDIPNSVLGRPLYMSVAINTLSGYVQCANASIDIPALGNDRDAINAFLNNGFYYE